ncbi:MAG TPA: hypothetical protein DE179_06150 [Oceanospirillaceae bacterium]|nr:hypothetical protein [Oceanospirillaceae bacterium]
MCLIVVAHQVHPNYPLLLAANRDEFRQRPTQRMHHWQQPNILAGKDLQAGGTWLGVGNDGRWAALTNYRDGSSKTVAGPSRGHICTHFIEQDLSALHFAQQLSQQTYAGFNVLLWDGEDLVYYASQGEQALQVLKPGIYGLSNAHLDTNWPKVNIVKAGMTDLLAEPEVAHQHLQNIMFNNQLAAHHLLPDTGIPLDWEQRLSSCFIDAPDMDYGTRTCISILQDQTGQLHIKERDFDTTNSPDQDFSFNLTP